SQRRPRASISATNPTTALATRFLADAPPRPGQRVDRPACRPHGLTSPRHEDPSRNPAERRRISNRKESAVVTLWVVGARYTLPIPASDLLVIPERERRNLGGGSMFFEALPERTADQGSGGAEMVRQVVKRAVDILAGGALA